jgi:hypothetical protein
MRLPLFVVTRLAVHNFLHNTGMSAAIRVPDGSEAAPADAGDVGHLLSCILAAQERRARMFCEFRRGFEALLADGDLSAYNALCVRVGAAFADVSAEVNAAGAALRTTGRTDLFECVASLQQHEKEQLRLEVTLQVLKKEHAAGKWSWQRRVDVAATAAGDLRPSWASTCRAHAAPAAQPTAADEPVAGCSCGLGEPSEDEYRAAVSEATRALQTTVVALNDAVDELREAADECGR